MLGFPLLYFKGMRLMMFQLSGFYCIHIRLMDTKILHDLKVKGSIRVPLRGSFKGSIGF